LERISRSQRIQRILTIIREKGSARTDELAGSLGVSMVTVRRDLKHLQEAGRIVIGYGFVKLLESDLTESADFNKRLSSNREEKQKLAVAAIQFVEEGDVIFLDESSTCYVLALNLIRSFNNLHIITNAVHTLQALSRSRGFTVESSGGSLQYGFNSLVGPRAEETLRSIYANKFFFSCRAFKLREGTFELSPFSASIKRIMLENSEENYLLMDHTKLGTISPFPFAKTQEIHNVITDRDQPGLPHGKVKRIIISQSSSGEISER
jgi:DeoR family L-fucose operon activator